MASPQLRKARKKTREYLQDKNATSKNSAISIDDKKWKDLGWTDDPFGSEISKTLQDSPLSALSEIKVTKDGKYWYDKKRSKRANKTGCIIFIIGFIITLISIFGIGILGMIATRQQQASITTDDKARADQELEISGVRLLKYDEKGIIIATFKNEFIYKFTNENPGNLIDQSERANVKVAINGTFFAGTYQQASHAGLLILAGDKKSEIIDDPQLSHFVVYNRESVNIRFITALESNVSDIYLNDNFDVFQTGPLVIDNNQIQNDYIDKSTNGNGKYRRTLLGQFDTGEMFIVIATNEYTLKDLGKTVLDLPVSQGKVLDLINLDGGPSTAIYVKDHPEFNFNAEHDLPSVILVSE